MQNKKKFPEKFMFRLTEEEYDFLISQFVISKTEEPRGGRQKLPYVFTEPGIAMLSSILRSEIAIATSIILDCVHKIMYTNLKEKSYEI